MVEDITQILDFADIDNIIADFKDIPGEFLQLLHRMPIHQETFVVLFHKACTAAVRYHDVGFGS